MDTIPNLKNGAEDETETTTPRLIQSPQNAMPGLIVQEPGRCKVSAELHQNHDIPGGGIILLPFKTVIRLFSINPNTGNRKVVPLVTHPSKEGEAPQKFIALFEEEEDVNFVFQVDNNESTQRHLALSLTMKKQTRSARFIVWKATTVLIESLDPKRRKKFRVPGVSISCPAPGKIITPPENQTRIINNTINNADVGGPSSKLLTGGLPGQVFGQILMSIEYSVGKVMGCCYVIKIKDLRKGKYIYLEVGGGDRIGEVKGRIEEDVGFPPWEQRLIWKGQRLLDSDTICQLQIRPFDVVHLVRKLRHSRVEQLVGGRRPLSQQCTFTPTVYGDEDTELNFLTGKSLKGTVSTNFFRGQSQDVGEQQKNQILLKPKFQGDHAVESVSFNLELRVTSRVGTLRGKEAKAREEGDGNTYDNDTTFLARWGFKRWVLIFICLLKIVFTIGLFLFVRVGYRA